MFIRLLRQIFHDLGMRSTPLNLCKTVEHLVSSNFWSVEYGCQLIGHGLNLWPEGQKGSKAWGRLKDTSQASVVC
jgi:hypothetical protein